jgi:hypothetical protein
MRPFAASFRNQMRSAAVLISVFATLPSAASEGMIYAALYHCEAASMNQALVQLCGAKYPSLVEPGSRALSKWQSTFGDAASRAAAKCRSELAKRVDETRESKHASLLEDLRTSWRTEMERTIAIRHDSFCRSAISEIEQGRWDRGEWKD